MACVLGSAPLAVLRAARCAHAALDANQLTVLHRRIICFPGQPRDKLHAPIVGHGARGLDLVLVVSEHYELPTQEWKRGPLLRAQLTDLVDIRQHLMEIPIYAVARIGFLGHAVNRACKRAHAVAHQSFQCILASKVEIDAVAAADGHFMFERTGKNIGELRVQEHLSIVGKLNVRDLRIAFQQRFKIGQLQMTRAQRRP